MSKMVERLSRAFADREGWVWDDLHPLEDTSFGWGQNHIRQHVYENIKAMREDAEAMSDSVAATVFPRVSIGGGRYAGVSDCLRAMIDAALVSEKECLRHATEKQPD